MASLLHRYICLSTAASGQYCCSEKSLGTIAKAGTSCALRRRRQSPAGFARDDSPAAKLQKLEAVLARAAPPDEDVALLADLLSLPASRRHPLPNLTPEQKKEWTLEALIRQLEGLARRQPVLVLFEDAHWIVPTSRELLDLTVERARGLPVLLIVTFRLEFQRPWTGRPQVTMLALNRLDRHDRTALVQQIARGKALPD